MIILSFFFNFIHNNVIDKNDNRFINRFEFLKDLLKKNVKVFINIVTFYINYDTDLKIEIINVFDFLFNEKEILIFFFFK